MKRREFVGTVGSAGVLGLAGCADEGSDGEEASDAADGSGSRADDGLSEADDDRSDGADDGFATLQRLTLVNAADEPSTMELRIERDDTDERVHAEEYDLPAGLDGAAVDCVWPDAPLTVMTRRADGGEWSRLRTADGEGCLNVLAEIDERGTTFFTADEDCPIRSPECHAAVGE